MRPSHRAAIVHRAALACAVAGALPLLAACAERAPPPASAAAPPARVVLSGPTSTSPLAEGLSAACRAEAERATVFQNRGEMMRLDEYENRGRDSLMQNQQERGLLVVRRERLYRECLARGSGQSGQPPAGAAPRQTATPR